MKMRFVCAITGGLLLLLCGSCLKKGLYKDEDEGGKGTAEKNVYIYPYGRENGDVVAEITIQADGNVDLNNVDVEIPGLKYNKS